MPIPHVFLYPFYVQSYVTSGLTSLEIYFAEIDNAGSGFEAYKALLKRTDGLTFSEHIEAANLTSPFDENMPKNIADKLYYHIVGAHFYK